jgi:single-strand DNA-binding protein
MNSINLTGRITDQPARRVTTANGVVAEFRLAVDGRPRRLWITVEAWGHEAGKVARYLDAGRHVAVTGRLVQDEYLVRTGHRHTSYKVVAHRVDFLDAPPSDPDEHGAAPQQPASFGVTAEHSVANDVAGGA